LMGVTPPTALWAAAMAWGMEIQLFGLAEDGAARAATAAEAKREVIRRDMVIPPER
jgi:hypothetical protein